MPVPTPHTPLIVPSDSVSRAPVANAVAAWRTLDWLAVAFLVLGLTDIALGWFPLAFGKPEWEFGTISGSLNALTIPMFGLYLLLASAIARGDRRAGRVVAAIMAVLALFLAFLGVVYLTVAPIAIRSVADAPGASLGIRKAIAKALLLGVAYLVLLIVGARKGWRVGRVPR
jgi:hypothetical protein